MTTENGKPMSKWQRFLVMKPLLLRSLIVAASAVLVKVFNITVITDDAISAIVDFFTAASAMIAYLWGQGTVTANSKVLLEKPDPDLDLVYDPGTAVGVGEAALASGEKTLHGALLRAQEGDVE